MRSMNLVAGLTALLSCLATAAPAPGTQQIEARAGSLTQVQDFGKNPSGIKMFTYVPAKLAAKPPRGAGAARVRVDGELLLRLDQTPKDGDCWDVSSDQTLTHDGGGDSTGLANMVKYALKKYNGDASRVYVTGESSGAMMTQVMAAVYPDMFAAASEFSGEPAGCFRTGSVRGWNSQCAGGQVNKSPADWAAQVHKMYPGYTGTYPKMLVWHGDVDKTLNINSFNESIKEWSGIFGYSGTAKQTQENTPGARLTKYIYGDRLQGIWGHGFGHVVPTNETEALTWFGILSDRRMQKPRILLQPMRSCALINDKSEKKTVLESASS
ncbi:cellulose binding protein [Apiospora rasikravindrae]|uniref:Cellulose binding protein n=1 Tax=Apiospora rasikravindrae TaxID=990691 RepID=A0ABR1SK78_9PEZI